MPNRPPTPCTTPGCPGRVDGVGACPVCAARRNAARPTAASQGYGQTWATITRPDYLRRHPDCRLCGAPATIPDHWPRSRKQLIAAGVHDPDGDQYLRPLCERCHRRQTGLRQPGGWRAHRL